MKRGDASRRPGALGVVYVSVHNSQICSRYLLVFLSKEKKIERRQANTTMRENISLENARSCIYSYIRNYTLCLKSVVLTCRYLSPSHLSLWFNKTVIFIATLQRLTLFCFTHTTNLTYYALQYSAWLLADEVNIIYIDISQAHFCLACTDTRVVSMTT